MIRCALRNFAPDVLICLGPEIRLVLQLLACIEEKWWGLGNKSDFTQMQKQIPKY